MTNGTLLKGAGGTMTALGGVYVSWLPYIEMWLRIASLAVGLAVGLVTLYSLTSKMLAQKKKEQDECDN